MIRRFLSAGFLAVGLVLLGLAAFGTSTANAQEIVTIHASTLTDHASSSTEWHFVITQVEGTPPASITVQWSNGTSSVLPLAKLTGGTAHYSTTQHLGDGVTVVGATAVVPEGTTVGNFNLSHGPTGNNGGTTTTTTVPEPTTTVPEPTTTVPEPTTTVPEPTTTVPEPTTTVPGPTTTLPEPTTAVPGPTTTVPEPTTTVPAPVVEGVVVTPETNTPTSATPATALATTGSATVPVAIAGVGALIGGTALVLSSRRRPT